MPGENDNAAASGGDLHPAGTAEPARDGADKRQPENPRTRGHSPTLDARDQAPPAGAERTIKIGGAEYSEQQVRDSIAHKIEQDARKSALPKSPADYQLTLPPAFQAPEGVTFEPDYSDPLYQFARDQAFRRGMDQETFSELYGVYAAAEIAKHQHTHYVREANLAALGSAAPARLDAISTWLTARAGDDGKAMGEFLHRFPAVGMVRAVENLMRQFSGQGGADFSQSGRQQQEQKPNIPAFDGGNFNQVRAAQDASRGVTWKAGAPTPPNFHQMLK
jgi:hypothetical protein